MKKIIQVGETLRLYLPYADVDTGVPIDPLVLSCTMVQPSGSIINIVYPESDFVRESEGQYFVRLSGVQIGTHSYMISAQLSADDFDVRSGKFDVEPAV